MFETVADSVNNSQGIWFIVCSVQYRSDCLAVVFAAADAAGCALCRFIMLLTLFFVQYICFLSVAEKHCNQANIHTGGDCTYHVCGCGEAEKP